jgi:hypothetical protein
LLFTWHPLAQDWLLFVPPLPEHWHKVFPVPHAPPTKYFPFDCFTPQTLQAVLAGGATGAGLVVVVVV